jgi:hypothetical protein
MAVLGWKLDRIQRAALLKRFPPSWPDVIADHVTLRTGGTAADPPPRSVQAEIVGSVDDGAGLQALVVAVDGTTERPDGGIYHITWSLDRSRGRKPVESNAVLAEHGWRPLPEPVVVKIEPSRFD